MSKKQEERYALTVLGLLKHAAGEVKGREVYDAIELHMRRNGLGIALVDEKLAFVKLVKEDKP